MYQPGLLGAEFGAVGDVGCIRQKNNNSWCTTQLQQSMSNTGSINPIQSFMLLPCPFNGHCMNLLLTSPNHLELLDMFSGEFACRSRGRGTNDSCHKWGTLATRVVSNMCAYSIHLCLNAKEESTLAGGTSKGRTRECIRKNYCQGDGSPPGGGGVQGAGGGGGG